MSYALLGGCQYESQFTTDNGEITLWIEQFFIMFRNAFL